MSKTGNFGTPRKYSPFAVTMKSLDEPPYLPVGTDVSAKYRGAFCEAKIKSTKRLVKVKVTFRQDSSTAEVQDDHVKGPLKVGAVVEIKNPDGTYQEAVINKLTDASWYTVVFDDGDEKTLRRSSLCLKGERHFAESETLDQLPLTNPEHFGTPVIGKKTNRGRRSNHVPEEESSSSSSDEDVDESKNGDELMGKVVCVDFSGGEKKKGTWFPALVVSPDCIDDIVVKKDFILIRSFKDGKFSSVPRKDVRDVNDISAKNDNLLKQGLDQALEFSKDKSIPSNWKTEVKEESSSSEAEDEEEENKDNQEDNSSEDEEEEIEPFPGENENFLQQLYKFMEDRGTPINKRPVLGYRNLNLFKLFRLVHKLGGFSNIESGAVWKQVYQDLGIPVLNSAAGYNVKCAYKKYLYGFEKYCTSANITFHMELPMKVTQKTCEECDHEDKVVLKQEPEIQESNVEASAEEPNDEQLVLPVYKHSMEEEMINTQCCNENEVNKIEENNVDNEETTLKGNEFPPKTEEEYVGEKVEESANDLTKDDFQEDDQGAVIADQDNGEEGSFENFPLNMKLQVRYDEWMKADKIVRPADKSVPKIKHRKKIKTNMDQDKVKLENDEISPNQCRLFTRPLFQPCDLDSESTLDDIESKNSLQGPPKAVEITSILNGLQAAESSADDSENDQSLHNLDIAGNELDTSHTINELIPKEEETITPVVDDNPVTVDLLNTNITPGSPAVLKEEEEYSDDTDSSELESTKPRKDLKKDLADKATKMKRGTRKNLECGKTGSPSRKDENAKCKETIVKLDTGIISSSDEEEKCKPKNALTKKYNGLEDKRKSLRTSTFYPVFTEVPEKRAKLLNHSEERIRAKDRKDVWSSIQGQWPKKTLKELFSDSDTEGASSPPPMKLEDSPSEVPVQETKEVELLPSETLKPVIDTIELKPVEENAVEIGEKKVEFPSSGSNSVLNTPPTTPESPSSLSECRRPQSTVENLEALEPSPEEVQSVKSETDSTIEVDSVAGEMNDLQFEGNISPTGFDASVSSSSSNQPEPESKDTGPKRLSDDQNGNLGNCPPKKLKRSHKSSAIQKKNKITNTSDSEELSGGENLLKMQSAKTVSGLKSQHTKVASRTHSLGKFVKNRERELFHKEYVDRLPKVYKWSFQMSDIENLTSVERIAFLQEKLQELRKHYLSLKSEVASIDRRRKRFKKKERESAVVSSTSSSPSSSSITAAVMLTLADPSLSSSSQNAMPVECR